jgi:tetratricopeptide (TPR) repeat protein
MGREWKNPRYEYFRHRRQRLALVVVLVAAGAFTAFWLQRRGPAEIAVKKPASLPALDTRPVPMEGVESEDGIPDDPAEMAPDLPVAAVPESGEAWRVAEGLFSAGRLEEALDAYRRLAAAIPLGRGRTGICLARLGRWDEAIAELQGAVKAFPGDFAARFWLAQALYRQNKLEQALEQVQAALDLKMDGELLELREKLNQEIRIQRNYDSARTANFIVLFDGYEHDEVKHTVLGILKSAYAEIGKELNHFPDRPITVILYTAKDFSDVTRAPEWAGGMFGQLDGKIRVPVQGIAGREAALRRVLTHEYVHALLYALAPECPLWLHEGLAQYLCGDRAVNASQLLPLRMLVDSFPGDARLAYVAYMESLQAVSDLVDEHGMPPLRRLLAGLGEGHGLEAAFAAAYGKPFRRWAEQWRPVKRDELAEELPDTAENDG